MGVYGDLIEMNMGSNLMGIYMYLASGKLSQKTMENHEGR